ncbi:hypothetical protein ACM66B_001972 [Microbotryomycetes sp. NB124-2]
MPKSNLHDSLDSGLSSLKSALDQCDRLIVENHVPFSPPCKIHSKVPSQIPRLVVPSSTSGQAPPRHVTRQLSSPDDRLDDSGDGHTTAEESVDAESLADSSWESVGPTRIAAASGELERFVTDCHRMTSLLGSQDANHTMDPSLSTRLAQTSTEVEHYSLRVGVSRWLEGTRTQSSKTSLRDESEIAFVKRKVVDTGIQDESYTWRSEDVPVHDELDDTGLVPPDNNDVKPVVGAEGEDGVAARPEFPEQANDAASDESIHIRDTRNAFRLLVVLSLLAGSVSLVLVDKYVRHASPLSSESAGLWEPASEYASINVSIVPADLNAPEEPVPMSTMLPRSWTAACGVIWAAALFLTRLYRSPPIKVERERDSSPLLEMNATAIERARKLLERGTQSYHLGQVESAEDAFKSVTRLACSASDKTSAYEWLGRCLYRQGRYDEAKFAFERVLSRSRVANPTARASLGRTEYRLGRFKEAVRHLRGALKRHDALEFAHEFLGKALVAIGSVKEGEQQLERGGCQAWAFLGERMHLVGRLAQAEEALKRATSLRYDYPGAHARLALVYTERLDKHAAATHWRHVIASCDTGLHDQDLSEGTRRLVAGTTPHLALVAALDDVEEQARVVDQARRRFPSDLLLRIISLVLKAEDDKTELRKIDVHLKRRIARRTEDEEALVLRAIVQLGLDGSPEVSPLGSATGQLAWAHQMLRVLREGKA